MLYSSRRSGFTLVELLVVMAILAVLIGLSVAGLGYAMRRSRNIARESAMSNLENALTSYYDRNQEFPAQKAVAWASGTNALIVTTTPPAGDLKDYLEGSWDAGPANSEYWYRSDETKYAVCVSQEKTPSGTEYSCVGTALGQAGWPTALTASCASGICGTGVVWDGSGWSLVSGAPPAPLAE